MTIAETVERTDADIARDEQSREHAADMADVDYNEMLDSTPVGFHRVRAVPVAIIVERRRRNRAARKSRRINRKNAR